jgi:hypothetical protein
MALFLESVRRIGGMAYRYDTAIVTNVVFHRDAPQGAQPASYLAGLFS